jgi:hypothetical protein
MSVGFTVSGALHDVGKPKLVTSVEEGTVLQDIAPDGKTFVVFARGTTTPQGLDVTFVVNFFDESGAALPWRSDAGGIDHARDS